MVKLFVTLTLSLFLLASPLSAQDYVMEQARSEDSTAAFPFSLARVEAYAGGLRLFIVSDDIEAVASLFASDALEAQLSDHNAETTAEVSLSLGKAVHCSGEIQPIYMAYEDPLPICGGQPPERIELFFDAPVTLGSGRDLAIVQDPDFFWIIEEKQ